MAELPREVIPACALVGAGSRPSALSATTASLHDLQGRILLLRGGADGVIVRMRACCPRPEATHLEEV